MTSIDEFRAFQKLHDRFLCQHIFGLHQISNTRLWFPIPDSSFRYQSLVSNTRLWFPIPDSVFQYQTLASNTRLWFPIPDSGFQYQTLVSIIPDSGFQLIPDSSFQHNTLISNTRFWFPIPDLFSGFWFSTLDDYMIFNTKLWF